MNIFTGVHRTQEQGTRGFFSIYSPPALSHKRAHDKTVPFQLLLCRKLNHQIFQKTNNRNGRKEVNACIYYFNCHGSYMVVFLSAMRDKSFPLPYAKLSCSRFSLLSYSAFQYLSAAGLYSQQIPKDRKNKQDAHVSQRSPAVHTLTYFFFKQVGVHSIKMLHHFQHSQFSSSQLLSSTGEGSQKNPPPSYVYYQCARRPPSALVVKFVW